MEIPSSDSEVEVLAQATERAFEFLSVSGWVRSGRRLVRPRDFRGGFVLHYASGSRSLEIRYLDVEVVVALDGLELFGPTKHSGFSGNQFSRENLSKHIAEIASAVRAELPS